jgi:hypothetical protein
MSLPTLSPIRGLGGPWPSPTSTVHVTVNSRRHYRATGGEFEGDLPGATSILKILGLSTEGLIKWSANEERKACLLAADELYRSKVRFENFPAAIEAKLGAARAHSKLLSKAADIGAETHRAIQSFLSGQMSLDILSPPAKQAFDSWLAWWTQSGLKPVRVEQVVWDTDLGYAGTVDLVALTPDGQLEVWDWKSGKAIYDEYHLQLAAYCHACRGWAPVRPGGIVRLPKYATDPGLEVKTLGDMYGRQRTEEELMDCFRALLKVFQVMT